MHFLQVDQFFGQHILAFKPKFVGFGNVARRIQAAAAKVGNIRLGPILPFLDSFLDKFRIRWLQAPEQEERRAGDHSFESATTSSM